MQVHTKLDRSQVIKMLKDQGIYANRLIDVVSRVMVVDYSNNPLAPENYAYKVFYSDLTGARKKFMFYPFTVGAQGCK